MEAVPLRTNDLGSAASASEAAMPTAPVTAALAAMIEQGEVNAWIDLYEAAPRDFAERHGLALVRRGDVVATLCRTIPFIHFNSVMNLGMSGVAEEDEIDEFLAIYRDAGVDRPWFYHIPHSRPDALQRWLESRHLTQHGGWDRIYRNGRPQIQSATGATDGLSVEQVTAATAVEWAAFIDGIYGLPTSPWLIALVGRPGWSHYTLRQADRILAVRSMFMDGDGVVWLGIDAPVPGIMAPSFDLDAMICETMVRDGLAAGARYFVGDIEAPLADGDGPAYRNFARLGFSKAYFRAHYAYRLPESG
jgi:hypothetical protein